MIKDDKKIDVVCLEPLQKWKIFNGEEKVVFNYCNKALTDRRNDGTKYLSRHFEVWKRNLYKYIRKSILMREHKKR